MAKRSETKPAAAGEAKPRRRRRPAAEIRARLIRAAGDEFRQFGFSGATTAAIARRADVTEAQLFRYFPSKAELFREAVFDPLTAHFAEFNARHPMAASSGTRREQARLYVGELQQFLDEHSKLLLSLIAAQTFTSGSLQGMGEIDSLRAYFERGAAMMSSRVGGAAPVDPQLLVRVSFAAVLGAVLFKEWVFPPGLASAEAIDAAIFNFVIDGINVNPDPALQPAPPPPPRRKKR